MRKKWGIILGLTGMMLLGSQSIYAAEAADGTAETTDAANEKETAGTDDIESRIKKGGFTAGVSVHDPSVIKDNDTYYIFGSHMESAKSADLRNWIGFSSGVNAENKLFDNLFDGEEDGDPAAFTYVGKNEEGGYSVWAPAESGRSRDRRYQNACCYRCYFPPQPYPQLHPWSVA